jgi:hypothetical protein
MELMSRYISVVIMVLFILTDNALVYLSSYRRSMISPTNATYITGCQELRLYEGEKLVARVPQSCEFDATKFLATYYPVINLEVKTNTVFGLLKSVGRYN